MNQSMFSKAGLLACILFLGALSACKTQQLNTLSHREKRSGWQLLFNGKNLDGWHGYLMDKPGTMWKVRDSAIMLDHTDGGTGGDLVTNGEYENFDLQLDWKISVTGNSGIIFDVHEDPKYRETYLTGPEMQVLDNVKASDNKKKDHLAGSLYDLIPCDPSTVHPTGQWNHVRVLLDKGHLTFWMNGKKVVETQMWDAAWDKLVAGSKFHRWKEFATYHKGHIALQNHGHDVWYRNIRIRAL
ncbi:MAG TPA: DUF1080 domain-containing protein [Chitinophagaceae bacterium]|jgi:hypothetical protein|nr:DUF1080 domain-containing protein [Chitinophagaceae bacterium]